MVWLAIGVSIAFGAHARAQVITSVACKAPAQQSGTIYKRFTDVAGYGASNSIGDVDIRIAQLAATHSVCLGERDARLRFEGSLSIVDVDGGGDARGGLAGVGLQFALGSRGSATPIVRLGYEDFERGDDQVVADVAVMLATTIQAGGGPPGKEPLLVLEWTPEYTSRQSTAALNQGLRFDNAAFTNYAAIGYDTQLGQNFRGRVGLGHRYIGGDNLVSSIGTLSASFRPISLDCGGYCWNFEVSYSRGDHDYEGLMIGVARRFGR
ncbi:hypothetical protein AS593_12000 [Caulobacter vibrioides]|nr:hypothetical protein AS593_12000 [Caulobacter vibrioides]